MREDEEKTRETIEDEELYERVRTLLKELNEGDRNKAEELFVLFQNRVWELQDLIEDYKVQNQDLIKVVEGSMEESPIEDYSNDPEFLRMEQLIDNAETIEKQSELYKEYVRNLIYHDGSYKPEQYKIGGRLPLHRRIVDGDLERVAPVESDPKILEDEALPYGKIYELYLNTTDEKEIFPKRFPTEWLEGRQTIRALADLAKNPWSERFVFVDYGDLYVWVGGHPNAHIWAFNYSGATEHALPQFFYSENGMLYHLPLDRTAYNNIEATDAQRGLHLIKQNEWLAPNMPLMILTIPEEEWYHEEE